MNGPSGGQKSGGLVRIATRTPGGSPLPMASHRIGARLSRLSPEQLCAFIDEQAPLWSDAALRVAEGHAARVEQPEWVLSKVLLSPDLAPHILAQLPIEAHAAKGTCRAWRRDWKWTLPTRERPRMLVIGGNDNSGRLIGSLERYDASTNEWAEEAVATISAARRFAGTAVLDGKLYAVGGASPFMAFHQVERYDLATHAWEAVAPLATARTSHAMAVLDGKLYAVGGAVGGGTVIQAELPSRSVERYDPVANAWEAVAPMATARCYHAVAVLDGRLYAVGGRRYDSTLSSVEQYDPATDTWQEVAPLATGRSEHTVAVLDRQLYAVGGWVDANALSLVERYDATTNAWEAVAPMALARCLAATAVLDGNLYAIGGCDKCEDSDAEFLEMTNTVERYDPATNAWEPVAPMVTAQRSPVCVVI